MNGIVIKKKKYFLLIVFGISLAGLVLLRTVFLESYAAPNVELMKRSAKLAEGWFDSVESEKQKLGIKSDAVSSVANSLMLGNDFTELTTTLGSLEAKELSTNPQFAALFTKLLVEEKIGKGSVVGMSISGSFPSLAISMLAALQTLEVNVVLFSSLGASSYGANQPEATWIDIENWLRNKGGLIYKTDILTFGAEDDNGGGLMEGGIKAMKDAAERNGYNIFIPGSLKESIEVKTSLLEKRGISLYINIGGNQASMGSCPHSVTIPNGINKAYKICIDDERGILSRLAGSGIDFLHVLNIKDLAFKNGILLEPGVSYGNSDDLYNNTGVNKTAAVFTLFTLILMLIVYKRKYSLLK